MNATILYATAMLSATVFDVTFDRANEAYRVGDFTGAVTHYEQLVADGVADADVFYNLGNAYFRSNQLGAAIANYERALQIDPSSQNAAQNLQLCIEQTPRGAGRPLPPDWEQSLLFWHYGLSIGASATAAVASWLAAWGLLLLRLIRPMPYTRAVATGAFVLAALFATSVWSKSHPLPLAVANAVEVPVFFDRDANSPIYFQLLEGDRVIVEQAAPGWLKIEAPGGERGWAQENAFVLVGPPYERPQTEGVDPENLAPAKHAVNTP
jgi:tetratricopeptide (TPR) repeat protein